MTQEMVELRRGTPAVGWGLIGVAGAIVAGAIYMAILNGPEFLGLAVFAVPPLAIGAWGLIHRIRIFDDGIEVWTFVSRRKVLFQDAQRLTYRMVKLRSYGVSVGYYVGFVLRGGGRKVTYQGRLEGDHASHLEAARDRIAAVLADKAEDALVRGEPFKWVARGSRVTLRNDGLGYRPQRFVGRGDEELVPYSSAFGYTFGGGFFNLLAGDKTLFMEEVNGDDFYPGLELFARLVRRGGGSLEVMSAH